ncbi:DUF929 family protein [Aciditerrimonas ferrireducens]|uniref:DUF929 family protein n=1 Tax=Aciditerrimonas ferrireducens TaxID=667306 RepID=UPI002002C8AC|nr:DUF929 family protein [Aciditerrimonas ferrireducens]MCK4176803.1 DUF929 domain-containing protein [Aciditerrimonas ferrireducens]
MSPEAEATAPARHPRRVPLALATMALVVVVLLVALSLLVVRLTTTHHASGPPPTPLAPASLVTSATGVPGSVLDEVGAPGAPLVTPPQRLGAQTTLLRGSLPEVLYVGAEFCPFCAAERWPLVVALSRFGRFEHLGQASSATGEVFPSVPSFSFRGATYQSPYLAFSAIETYSASTDPGQDSFQALERVPPADRALLSRLDRPPSTAVAGSLPVVDLAGRALVIGAQFSPGLLSGLSASTVARDLTDPTSPVAQAVDGAANELTAVLCEVTGGRPGALCTSPAVRQGRARLTSSGALSLPAG